MDVAGDAQTLAASLNHSALNLANASGAAIGGAVIAAGFGYSAPALAGMVLALAAIGVWVPTFLLRRRQLRNSARSEEHTSELQSRGHLVCRLLLEKKKT